MEKHRQKLNLSQPAKGKPNVLLVMLDDVGFGSFSAFGGEIPSPGVDKVAQRVEVQSISHHGIVFTNAGGPPDRAQSPQRSYGRDHRNRK